MPFSRVSASGSPSTRSPSRSRSTAPSADHAGKAASTGADRRAARRVEPVHLGVGVVDRRALLGEHRRGGRLAHADRAGEADDDHARASSAASASAAHVDVGRRRAAEQGLRSSARAWPISMASPSTVRRPRGRAPRQERRAQRPVDHVHHHRAAGQRAESRARGPSPPPRPSEVALIIGAASVERRRRRPDHSAATRRPSVAPAPRALLRPCG